MGASESVLHDEDASFEDRMEFLLKGTKEAKKRGPPPVYSAILPSPAETWFSFSLFHKQTLETYKNAASNEKQVTVQTTLLPAVEHGVAPDVTLQILRNQMQIRDVAKKVNHLHKGKCLFVKTVFDPCKIVAVSTLVQDHQGDCVMLSLYNFDRKIPKGSMLLILEPYMRNGQDDPSRPLTLRCDNPQCIVMYDSLEEWEAAKEGRYPTRAEDPSASALRAQGNALFQQNEFEEAKKVYQRLLNNEKAAETDIIACLSNLAETCLRLEQWEQAEAYAKRLLTDFDPDHLKGRFRRVRALTYLNRPSEARQLMDSLLQSDTPKSTKKVYMELSREIDRCLKEHEEGSFDFEAMRRDVKRGSNKVFHADYHSPRVNFGVEIETQGGAKSTYRGCQATQDIKSGTLLCACKAIAYVSDDGAYTSYCNPFTGEAGSGKEIEEVNQCISKILRRPQLGKELYKLSAGAKFQQHVSSDDSGKLDIPRIRAIVKSNSFKGGQDVGLGFDFAVARCEREDQLLRQLNKSECERLSQGIGNDKGTGLWVQASLFNHSCTPNCTWWNIGDHMFVVTSRNVRAKEELCISYTAEDTFEKRSEVFRTWVSPKEGFSCVCSCCDVMRNNPALCEAENEVDSAYTNAAMRVQRYNSDMGSAAEASLPAFRRRQILDMFQSRPLGIQRQTVRKTLILEGTCLSRNGQREEARQAFEQVALVGYAYRGASGGNTNDYLHDMWRVVGSSMDCNRQDIALQYLREAYWSLYHTIFGSLHQSSSAAKKLNKGFILLTRKYASPYWTQLLGHPVVVSELDQLCKLAFEPSAKPQESLLEKRLQHLPSSSLRE